MAEKKAKTTSQSLANLAIEGIFDKKGESVVRIDLRKMKNAVADFFVICHGNSSAQVEAIAESVEMTIKKNSGEKVWKKEGFENAEWILLDFVDVVVHIFQAETRKYYRLEELWADAEVKSIETPASGSKTK
ncbi:MAG: ribosome silencing factor [Lentimicrobiaceae bacterium]|nr:ribosome silencing factor [Lentimicrobiaceae bacterium]